MKIVLTEKQYNRLVLEQPDSHFDTAYNKEFVRKNKQNLPILGIDDTIDIISAIIDGIPGIGNLVSAGIDIAHTISYCVRFYYADESNIEKKIEYGTLAFITLGATFIPVEGNSLPIMARQGLKKTLSQSPDALLKIAQKLGLYKQTVLFLKKSKWKYSLLILLCKILGGELLERLEYVNQKLAKIYEKVKNYDTISEPVLALKNTIEELKGDVQVALPISKQI